MGREPRRIGYDGQQGLVCPKCGCKDHKTRKTERKEERIYRYKQCRNCGRSLHTTEVVDKERTGGYTQSSSL